MQSSAPLNDTVLAYDVFVIIKILFSFRIEVRIKLIHRKVSCSLYRLFVYAVEYGEILKSFESLHLHLFNYGSA